MDFAGHDYIVVGSGAAGATVAARLAEAGMRVLLIEAGPDPLTSEDPRARADYDVPAFHPFASENPQFAWDHRVSHGIWHGAAGTDDPKAVNGLFAYPRAGALGGCTAHNAMIFMVPPDSDWEALARQTGDPGWAPAAMARHRKALEDCRHRPLWRLLARLGIDPTGHGWHGWLPVEKAVPMRAFRDAALIRSLALAVLADLAQGRGWRGKLGVFLRAWGDPNDARRRDREQLCYTPLTTAGHARSGARERLEAVRRAHPDRLSVVTDCLVTRVLFDESGRASGVAWLRGRHLYRASPKPGRPVSEGLSRARREVILAGGAFATPQLLMLSGIGDEAQLRAHGIAPRVHLPEVGRNLQDRYEISVVYRMARPWRSLRGAAFAPGDPLHRAWERGRRGMYVSNGAALAALRRSSTARDAAPDVFLMGLMARFRGYYPGYAADLWPGLDGFSWTVLKGQTGNRAGTVRLASADPRDPPRVDFACFEESGDADLAGLVEGLEMARALARPLIARGIIAEEELPGPAVTGQPLREWVRANAWGHHACGSAAIGPVLDGSGRVHGVKALRVVDAAIFPRIPGLFIAAPIYLAAEKLAGDILAQAAQTGIRED
ncbi:GMC family oxidoreductase [Novosphingobium resinovorum]|uniref:GMC family oxidoreductase n=1 Tax=Novosphingobium resinovorum TaxID=158500 RepID=UPI002ED62B40|nr:GMC family oxidoreductase [Novosphingobium resinovorum]